MSTQIFPTDQVRTKGRVQLKFTGKGKTQQQFKEECDINNIMAKYQKQGAITHANENYPSYSFATSLNFRESMEIVTNAQAMFDDLPSSLRKQFGNSPEAFLDFVQNPDNADKMAEMGLSEPRHRSASEKEDKAASEEIELPEGNETPKELPEG